MTTAPGPPPRPAVPGPGVTDAGLRLGLIAAMIAVVVAARRAAAALPVETATRPFPTVDQEPAMSSHHQTVPLGSSPRSGSSAGATAVSPGGGWRRYRRGSTAALAISVIVGTLLLLWGADWLSRWGAQTLLAKGVQESTGLLDAPTVSIDGALFLPQVLRGRYDNVQIDLHGLSSGPMRIDSVHADLTGVHLPFHDVLVRKVSQIPIDAAQERVVLTYDDLNHYLAMTGRKVTVKPTPDNQIELTGSVLILGKTISASTDANLSARNGNLAFNPTQLHTNTALDGPSKALLGQRFTVLIPLDQLPFGQQVTDIQITPTGLVVTVRGDNLVVTT